MNILKSDCCNSLIVNTFDRITKSFKKEKVCLKCKKPINKGRK